MQWSSERLMEATRYGRFVKVFKVDYKGRYHCMCIRREGDTFKVHRDEKKIYHFTTFGNGSIKAKVDDIIFINQEGTPAILTVEKIDEAGIN